MNCRTPYNVWRQVYLYPGIEPFLVFIYFSGTLYNQSSSCLMEQAEICQRGVCCVRCYFMQSSVMYPLGGMPFLLLHVCQSWSAVANILPLLIRDEDAPCRRKNCIKKFFFLLLPPINSERICSQALHPQRASEIPVHKPGGWERDCVRFYGKKKHAHSRVFGSFNCLLSIRLRILSLLRWIAG